MSAPPKLSIWFLPHPRNEGSVIYGAHAAKQCEPRRLNGGGCALHGPTGHWAKDLPLVFKPPVRDPHVPGGMFRECEHEVLHDDPDDVDFRKSTGSWDPQRLSTCPCGCCARYGEECEVHIPF